MWQETWKNDLPKPSTLFGVGAIWYAGLAFIAAAGVVGAGSIGDVVSAVVLGVIFLGVAGMSARFAMTSSNWPSMDQLVRLQQGHLRIVRPEASEEEAAGDEAKAA